MMKMNNDFRNYTNEFLREFSLSKEKWGELKKLWDRKCSQEFVEWFNKIVAVALRNLSVQNTIITNQEAEQPNTPYREQSWGRNHLLIATKNGIRQRYHYATKTDELNFEALSYMLEKKADIKKWFQANKPDKESAFDDLTNALEFSLPNFNVMTMKPKENSYYGFQPQHSIKSFSKDDISVETFAIERGSVEPAMLGGFEFDRHSDYFDIYAILNFADGGKERVGFSASANNWNWVFLKDCLFELNNFLDYSIQQVKLIQADFDTWVGQVENKLMSYATLVAL